MDGEVPLPLEPYTMIKLLESGAKYTEKHIPPSALNSDPSAFFSMVEKLNEVQAQVGPQKLEEMAVQMVMEHFGLEEGDLNIVAEIVSPSKPLPPIVVTEPESPIAPELRSELNKRLMINAIIQGAAHGVQYRFLYEDKQCDAVNPELRPVCKAMMALADTGVWTQDERQFQHSQMSPAGMVNLDFSTKPITIYAKAIHFPILIHEIAKGVVEVLALSGLPKDREIRRTVLAHADTPDKEAWGITIGAELWRKLNKSIPADKSARERSALIREFFAQSASEFIDSVERLAGGQD